MFDFQYKDIDEGISVHFIQIDDLNEALKEYIDQNLINICRGENHLNQLKYIKKQLIKFFEKKDDAKKYGALGELFTHFYLSSIDFNPKFMFLNLEENSVKKGFDGFYERNEMVWILDSKSGRHDTKRISHRSKLKEAYRSVKGQLAGETNNNPWENAFQHANSRDINSSDSLLSVIRKFSNEYLDEEYADLSTLNIILASTIYWHDEWSRKEISEVLLDIGNSYEDMDFSELVLFCCNKTTFEIFFEYLKEEDIDGIQGEIAANAS